MHVKIFCIVTRRGALGLAELSEVEWHKRQKENILKAVGVKVDHGERLDYGESREFK
jgi:hypothetical protein